MYQMPTVEAVQSFQEAIGEAVRAARKRLGWTQGHLAERVTEARRRATPSAPAMSVDTISRLENGDNFQSETIDEIARALGQSFSSLASGVTSPVTDVREVQGHEEELLDVSGYERFSIPVIAEGDASPEGVFWDTETGVKLIEAEEWMSRPNDPAVKDPRCYGVKVRGDSMEPLLKPGMRVIVSPNLAVEDGGLSYVQLTSGERLIKVIHKHPAGFTLESFNRAYAPRFVAREEVKAVHRIAYIRTIK